MYISELQIDNFRSLKNIHLRNMQRICIFHGENNSGKSNVLAAIDAILRSKTITEPETAGEDVLYQKTGFHQGTLRNFADNFRFGAKDPITFQVSITFEDNELQPNQAVIEQITAARGPIIKSKTGKSIPARGLKLGDGHEKIVRITGEFVHVDATTCDTVTRRIDINTNYVLYDLIDNKPRYIPSLEKSKVALEEREKLVTSITNSLTDSYRLVPTHRAMGNEELNITDPPTEFLNPSNFKRSMFRLDTDRATHELFKEINCRFNAEPFSFGEISFAVDPKTKGIEIMVEKGAVRLPLERVGSGLQQILFLIANIVYNSHKIIGIEEIELNLSPEAQKRVFETLKSLVYQSKLINQVLVTSHSPYFRNRTDVRYFEVKYDQVNLSSIITPANKNAAAKFFQIPRR